MAGHVMVRVGSLRRLVLVCGLALLATVLRPVPWWGSAQEVPQMTSGAGPVDAPAPASARPDGAGAAGAGPPPVPAGVPAAGTQGRWIDAGKLQPGELLRTAAGTYVQLDAVKSYDSNSSSVPANRVSISLLVVVRAA